MERIIKIKQVEQEVTFAEWWGMINKCFPELVTASKIGLSMLAQLLIRDITNAGAVILLGPPSSGKTITTNIFSGINGFTYTSDSFTPKAFVSGAANVSKEDLKHVDMLPKLRHKLFVVRDLAPLFTKSDEQLQEILGIMTRILDGEGFSYDSGVHGQRVYDGDYLFFMLGATTPIHPRVWRVMGGMGPRILFYRMKARQKSKEELVKQLTAQNYKEKELDCNLTTSFFLQSLWHKHQEGITWDRENDPKEVIEKIVTMASLLAKLRGLIKYDKQTGDDYDLAIENADRLSQWFYNMARGHAVINGRQHLDNDDLSIILELAIDSATTLRSELFRLLISNGGSITTKEIEEGLNKSQTTALKLMKEFKLLGLAVIKPVAATDAGRPESALVLADEWEWFLSEECQDMLYPNPLISDDTLTQNQGVNSENKQTEFEAVRVSAK